ncbi:MAG: phosphohistidine phosphatase SixA [Ignavibacteria bacterium]
MDIYLIRHGDSVELDYEIAIDGNRYLTPQGRNKTAEAAERLKELKTEFDVILTSPLVRAVQTAEITASVLGYKGEIKTASELTPGSSFQKFLQLIKRNSSFKTIACFGHSPDVNVFCSGLLKSNAKDTKIDFKKSSVCKIDYDIKNESGNLIWFLNADKMELIKI